MDLKAAQTTVQVDDDDWLDDVGGQGAQSDPLVDQEWTRLSTKYSDVSRPLHRTLLVLLQLWLCFVVPPCIEPDNPITFLPLPHSRPLSQERDDDADARPGTEKASPTASSPRCKRVSTRVSPYPPPWPVESVVSAAAPRPCSNISQEPRRNPQHSPTKRGRWYRISVG
jgi:hypothetical protein